MRIVLDTNILARAAASPAGPAGELLDLIQPPHLLVLSPPMLSELAVVMAYERVRLLHGLDDGGIREFVEAIETAALVVQLTQDAVPRIVSHDPDDDVVIATAEAGKAHVLCTLDRHLRHQDVVAYCRQRSIRILTDSELLAEIRGARHDADES
jgi:putative PIN family toxin of toxin-antitoxin system